MKMSPVEMRMRDHTSKRLPNLGKREGRKGSKSVTLHIDDL